MGALPTDEFWKREFQEDKKLLIIAWGLVGVGVLSGALVLLLTQLPVWVAILSMLLFSGGGAALFFTRLQKLEQSSSDRSVIEKELQESEQRYRLMFHNNDTVKLLINPKSSLIVDANQAACEFYGYNLKQFRRLKITELSVSPSDKIQNGGQGENRKIFRHRLAGGALREVEMISSPVEVGEQRLLYAVIHDVTSYEQHEKELRAAQERYQSVADTQADLLCRFTSKWQLTFVNAAFCDFFGKANKALLDADLLKLMPVDAIKPFKAALEKLSPQNPAETFRYQFKEANGKVVWQEWTFANVFDERGGVVEIQALTRDITQQVSAINALRESETRYRNLVENAPQPLLVHNQEKTLYVNPAGVRQLNAQSPAQILGKNTFELVHPDSRKLVEAQVASVQKTGETSPVQETTWLGMNGHAFEAEVSVAAVEYLNKMASIISFHDVTERNQELECLRQSEARYQAILDDQDELISRFTPDGKLTYVNQTFCEFFDKEENQLLGLSFPALVPTEVLGKFKDAIASLSFTNPVKTYEYEAVKPDGEHYWLQWTDRALFDEYGTLLEYQSEGRNITDRMKALKALEESEEKFKLISESSLVGLSIIQDGKFKYINEAMTEIYIYSRMEMMAWSLKEMFNRVYPYDLETAKKLLQPGRDITTGSIVDRYQYRIVTKSNEIRWVDVSKKTISYQGKPANLVATLDITKRKRAEIQLEYLATHDPLTELPNRSLFYEQLDHAINLAKRAGQRLAVLFVDLDGFKEVNDAFGHKNGDLLLQALARRMQDSVRESDHVSRLAGDEFTIVFENVLENDVILEAANKVLDNLAKPYTVGGHQFMITASIGASIYPDHGDNAEDLLKNADKAMYAAKESGKNRCKLFDPKMTEK
ncbi:MAG: PAS domain S-box protein [Anaerolineales bacterium]|nr:PAS domain S-box protein [Anaerolineales bacterium]